MANQTFAALKEACQDNDYACDFAVINKSYAKDMEWSVFLYVSWKMYSTRRAPFFVVVPQKQENLFFERFSVELESGVIDQLPFFLTEEDVLKESNIEIPEHYTGWHIQQIIKLCFSKTRFARDYLTLDSAMIFSRAFDYKSLFSEEGFICTAAQPVTKIDFFDHYRSVGEKGWLKGVLVSLADSLEEICVFMGNETYKTHWYIAGNGFFNSSLLAGLENYAREKGVNGFVGLIDIAPYEFAWYGEYVYMKHRERFSPKGPLITVPILSLDDLHDLDEKKLNMSEDRYGFLFQPPASESIKISKIIELYS